jgi:hypothetical protein
MVKKIHINFKTPIIVLQSIKFHQLTTKGPFLDAHFGKLTKETPVGETYYIRPLTKYIPPCKKSKVSGCGCGGKGLGHIEFNFKNCFPATHFNTHSTSKNFKANGIVKISPFEWDKNGKAKFFENQIVTVNLWIENNTNLPLKGLHIHDGITKDTMAGFGPISYFLYTTPEWNKRYNNTKKSRTWAKKYAPLPPDNIIQKYPTQLTEYSSLLLN